MENNPFFEKAPKKRPNILILGLEIVAFLTAFSIVLYLFIFLPSEVDGPSMEPNFYTHQLYFANRLVQWMDGTDLGKLTGLQYQRGDVVVLQVPGNPQFIKRIVGLPGDKIAVRDGYLYINNKKMIEEYLPPARYTDGGSFLIAGNEAVEIPKDNFFVAGDNREVSYDSRYLGFIKRDWIKGRVFLRFWPLDTFGLIPTGKFRLE